MLRRDDFPPSFWRRFLSNIDVRGKDECHPYLGYNRRDGYGYYNGRLAHRLIYLYIYGKLSKRKLVCHDCDNPPCCNPRHLFEGTYLDNNRDMISKGRQNFVGP